MVYLGYKCPFCKDLDIPDIFKTMFGGNDEVSNK